MAVVLFVGAHVVPGSVVVLMLSVAVVLGAVAQWLATSKDRLTAIRRLLKLSVVGASVYMMYDCGWIWEWLCLSI